VTILAAAALAGCDSGAPVTVVQSKKDESYTAKLQQVLVVRNLFLPGMTELNLNGLVRLNEIRTAFNTKLAAPFHVRADYVDVTTFNKAVGDIAHEPAVVDAVAKTHPAQVLELNMASATMNPGVLKYTIDARLYDVASNKTVWRSLIIVDNMAGRFIRVGDRLAPSHQEEADQLVDALRSQLEHAGLL